MEIDRLNGQIKSLEQLVSVNDDLKTEIQVLRQQLADAEQTAR